MKKSIAMATYNGNRFLRAQLDSFAAQTCLPDEVIVCDDASSDNTVSILEEFSKNAPFKVRVIRNDKNIGYIKSFEKAMGLCEGEIIFLSDQDDVWFQNKLEFLENVFQENKNILVAINDQAITDEYLADSGLTVIGQFLSVGMPLRSFVAGCCTALRRSFLPALLPIPDNAPGHDVWIHCIASVCDARLIVNMPLQFYRRHGASASVWFFTNQKKAKFSDWIKHSSKNDPQQALLHTLGWLDTVASVIVERLIPIDNSIGRGPVAADAACRIRNERTAVMHRLDLLRQKNMAIKFLKASRMYLSGDYRYFYGWKSLIKDLIFPS